MRCGFIGLGHIGKFLAGSLVRNGFEVTIFDLNAEAGKPLVAKGAKWASSIKNCAMHPTPCLPACHRRVQLMQLLPDLAACLSHLLAVQLQPHG